MKKYKFLKDHGEYKEGDIEELNDDMANYLQRCSVVIEVKAEEAPTKKAPTKKK